MSAVESTSNSPSRPAPGRIASTQRRYDAVQSAIGTPCARSSSSSSRAPGSGGRGWRNRPISTGSYSTRIASSVTGSAKRAIIPVHIAGVAEPMNCS